MGTMQRMTTLEAFERERPHLLAVAFRILGTDADAEDAVQEAWIRYGRADVSQVQNLSAWLTTVVTRLCLDALRRRHDVPQDSADDVAARGGRLLNATRHGDTHRLIELLDPAVVRTADPQALRPGGAQQVRGREAVLAETRLFQTTARRAQLLRIDGQPGIAVVSGTHVQAALVFQVAGGRILRYDVIADPQRLALLHLER